MPNSTRRPETQQFFYKSNRLQQLRGFCAAAQFGNMSRAANHLGLTHASVSLQIKSLERDLGVSLFVRNGPKISLTKDGQTLLDLSLSHIEGIQNIHNAFEKEVLSQKKTELHVAANSTTLNFILPAIAKEFLALHQETFITIHYAEQQEALQKLRSKTVDFALLPRREHMPLPRGFHYMPLFYYVPSLITRPDHPLAGRTKLTVKEISKYELTLPAKELRVIPTLYDIFPQHEIEKRLRINFINWETTRKYIEAGLVISISSDVIIGPDDTLVATSLAHLFPMVDYGIVTYAKGREQKKVADFIDVARRKSSILSTHQ